jgi:formylglycine-generating enzyme required for sulfatase activity
MFRLLSLSALVVGVVACGNDSSPPGTGGSAGSPSNNTAGQAAVGGAGSGNVTAGSSGTATQAGHTGAGAGASAGGNSTTGGSGGNPAGGSTAGSSAAGSSAAGGGSAGGGSAGSSSTTTPPSCTTSGPGRTTCGDNGDESCCTSLPVAGGTYSRTYKNSGSGATDKADPATVSSFRLDKYEVTVARFREFVKALEAGAPPAAGSGKHTHLNAGKGLADSGKSGSFEGGWDAAWNSKIPSGAGATAKWKSALTKAGSGGGGCSLYGTWTDDAGKNDLLPITCTSWYESYAFCIWDGGFLPSEAEWKYATAGGDEQREYPWGTTAPGSMNEYAIYDCCYPDGKCSATSGSDTCTGVVNASKVGFAAKGAGRYGQVDLVGNVWEWNLDRYANYVSPCEDCAYLTGSTTNRVLPGAGFHTGANLGATLLYSYNRSQVSYDAETYRGDYAVGVRCARPM